MPDEWHVNWKRMAFQWTTRGGAPNRRDRPRTERRPTLLWAHRLANLAIGTKGYWRPVNGCIASAGCVATAGGDDCCLGLLTLVLLLANSRRIVCGRSGSKRIPCYTTDTITFNKHTFIGHSVCQSPDCHPIVIQLSSTIALKRLSHNTSRNRNQ